jgi:3-hydroxyacyl-[acyl-carrier-protein] dehydratase
MVGTTGLMDKNMLIYFMGIDNCKFRRKVVPGDVRMTVQTTRGKPGGKVQIRLATVDGELAAEAEFTAMMDMQA